MASVPSKMSSGAQNMKTGPYAFGTSENESESAILENGTRHPRNSESESGRAKQEKWDMTPSVPPKMNLGAQNVQTEPDALGIGENE
jgi:hypothetical protein